jgi:hypothetical protein
MALLDELLSIGYFPRELPLSFSTSNFAAKLLANRGEWPNEPAKVAKMCTYSLAKAGGLRRILSVPNPVCHVQLCDSLVSRWEEIQGFTHSSAISLSKPVRDLRNNRAVVPAVPLDELPLARVRERANAKYVVSTDLNAFYPSLYTHSVPWAIHGKAAAKAKKKATSLWGNELDRYLRMAQDNQTVGIPIGPDSSLVVAELVLSAVDHVVTERIPHLHGLRYMDDFEFYFPDPTSAENGLATLHEVLLAFELKLNPHKTTIEQAPISIQKEWVHSLANFVFSPNTHAQARDLIRYFDLLTKCFRENARNHAITYGLSRLRELRVTEDNWGLYQSLLAGAVTVEPGAINAYVDILNRCHGDGQIPDPSLTGETLNLIIERSAPLGHHHEMVWSLWAILLWGLDVTGQAAQAISKVENSFVAILALDAEQNSLISDGLDKHTWESRMTGADLYDDQWLLAYEANAHGWTPSGSGTDYVAHDPNFAHLKELGVEFYGSPKGMAGTAFEMPANLAALYG